MALNFFFNVGLFAVSKEFLPYKASADLTLVQQEVNILLHVGLFATGRAKEKNWEAGVLLL